MRLIGLFTLAVSACVSAIPSGDTAAVLDVIDGDTIRVAGESEDVRLVGINSPEWTECQGPEAASTLTELLVGRGVRLVVDASERDSYGRLLRFVFSGRTLVNEALVRLGFAVAYAVPPNVSAADLFRTAELAAESDQIGIWNPAACGPKSHAGLVIEGIQSGAGWTGEPTEGETVVIRNTRSEPVELDDWMLRDTSSSHRYHFSQYTIPGGGRLTISTGCGRDEPGRLYWCSNTPVWNDSGDHAFLLDPNGNIAAHLRY